LNALTVDVEDWYQSTYDLDAPVHDRVVRNTRRLLQLFDECDVRATFFVLGLVCEKYPHLMAEIKTGGHELATHRYSHRPVNSSRGGLRVRLFQGFNRRAISSRLRSLLRTMDFSTMGHVLGLE
jgi:peptidoglycan/xylan/chitin deacetylase (PgdA/CDA1 family)